MHIGINIKDQGFKSIKSAPKDGTRIETCCYVKNTFVIIALSHWKKDGSHREGGYWTGWRNFSYQPTHWRPVQIQGQAMNSMIVDELEQCGE